MKGNSVFNLSLNKIEFIHNYTMLIESVINKILESHNLIKDFQKIYPEIHTLYDLEDDVEKIKKMQDYYFNIAKEYGFAYEHLI